MNEPPAAGVHLPANHPFWREPQALAKLLASDRAEEQVLSTVENPWVWASWVSAVLNAGERAPALYAADLDDFIPQPARDLMGSLQPADATKFDFRTGQLATRIRAYAAKPETSRNHRTYDAVAKRAARFLFTYGGVIGQDTDDWRNLVQTVSQCRLKPDADGQLELSFSGDAAKLPLGDFAAQRVLTMGPGMSGATFAGELAGFADKIDFVSGGFGAEFINEFIAYNIQSMTVGLTDMHRVTPNLELFPGRPISTVHLPEVSFYKHGIADALGRLAVSIVTNGAAPVDAAFMVAVHSAGDDECRAGVRGAHQVLRRGGLFVVKAPTDKGSTTASDFPALRDALTATFGDAEISGPCGQLGFEDQELAANFAVYKKH
jgi:hypothetical protein